MSEHEPILRWIDSQGRRMRAQVARWAQINSGSRNLEGLNLLMQQVWESFAVLGGQCAELEFPPQQTIDSRGEIQSVPLGRALSIRKRPESSLRVFLSIHMDTVYGADDPFQQVTQPDDNTFRGPGVADAKGGLAVMLVALEALERSPLASQLGWEVLINPDEEIGSPGSVQLLIEAAKRNDLGLVFEPALADGTMFNERKGSGNFTLVIRGRAAHAGRDFASGRSALVAAADFVMRAHALNGKIAEMTLNIGRIDGGGPVNVVPGLAIVRLNVRVARPEDQAIVESELRRVIAQVAGGHEVATELHGGFYSPPMRLDGPRRHLCHALHECGRELGMDIHWVQSGGASDGNKLAAAGLPVLDTMGPRGGNLHSPQEFVLLDSLTEKAKLAALFLLRLAEGRITALAKSEAA